MRRLSLGLLAMLSCATAPSPSPAPRVSADAGERVPAAHPVTEERSPLAGEWLSSPRAVCRDEELRSLWERWVLDGAEESASGIDLRVQRRGGHARIEWVAEGLADDAVAQLRVRYEALRTPEGWRVLGCTREALRCHRGAPREGRCP